MRSSTVTKPRFTVTYDYFFRGFVILDSEGYFLQRKDGSTRVFSSASSAHKAVTRARRPVGDRHR